MRVWFSKEGEVNVRTSGQETLINSDIGQAALNRYQLFYLAGNQVAAEEIAENIENAMQIQFERDTGITSPKGNQALPTHSGTK
jgi:hypothetical protein